MQSTTLGRRANIDFPLPKIIYFKKEKESLSQINSINRAKPEEIQGRKATGLDEIAGLP